MKKAILSSASVLLLAAAIAAFFYLCDTDHASARYTRVDNSRARLEQTAYCYTLDAYDASGAAHSLQFQASRLLQEGAYLMLKVMPLRGVVSWEEVSRLDLPEHVRAAYAAGE